MATFIKLTKFLTPDKNSSSSQPVTLLNQGTASNENENKTKDFKMKKKPRIKANNKGTGFIPEQNRVDKQFQIRNIELKEEPLKESIKKEEKFPRARNENEFSKKDFKPKSSLVEASNGKDHYRAKPQIEDDNIVNNEKDKNPEILAQVEKEALYSILGNLSDMIIQQKKSKNSSSFSMMKSKTNIDKSELSKKPVLSIEYLLNTKQKALLNQINHNDDSTGYEKNYNLDIILKSSNPENFPDVIRSYNKILSLASNKPSIECLEHLIQICLE